MSLYETVRDLPLKIEGYELETLSLAVSSDWTRKTTLVRLSGSGEEGLGEDVTYTAEEHDLVAAQGATLPLAGTWTLASFSAQLEELAAFEHDPATNSSPDYRRWAYESAALDLALRQSGRSLAQAVGRDLSAVSFVGSPRGGMGNWLEHYPGMRFKLDAQDDWTDSVIAELASTGSVDVVDLKGMYGESFGLRPDADLYRRIAEQMPDALLEDPNLTPETGKVLAPHRDRITWDAPIHSVGDAEALPFPPKVLNCKPSRFATVRGLFDFYDYCAEHGISLYGGGQFELGAGRGQIQYLAALFHAAAPNDVAPGVYNEGGPRSGLPTSPLTLRPRSTGFLLLD